MELRGTMRTGRECGTNGNGSKNEMKTRMNPAIGKPLGFVYNEQWREAEEKGSLIRGSRCHYSSYDGGGTRQCETN